MSKLPMVEVFGFPLDNFSLDAERYRTNKLCPFNNKVPNCTKDKANDPLGVCSVFDGANLTITCPIRFREDWIIADDAAAFFFPEGTNWTALVEVRLTDKAGLAAGNIDMMLVSYDESGHIIDFGALEIQAVYISGNIRKPFEYFVNDPAKNYNEQWKAAGYPRPDYLSSSRKRLAPQLLYKGGIIKAWNKKQVVVLHSNFYNTLPTLLEVEPAEADIAWFIYDLVLDVNQNRYKLTRVKTVYTKFETALLKITQTDAGDVNSFINLIQAKLDEKLEAAPDAPVLTDAL